VKFTIKQTIFGTVFVKVIILHVFNVLNLNHSLTLDVILA